MAEIVEGQIMEGLKSHPRRLLQASVRSLKDKHKNAERNFPNCLPLHCSLHQVFVIKHVTLKPTFKKNLLHFFLLKSNVNW